MKKILLTASLAAACLFLAAQIPQGFNYQAVAHSNTGAPIMNTTIQVKIGILSDTLTPVVIWEELHSSVRTNTVGLFTLVIGTGVKQAGSAAAFSNINWNASPLYLKVQVNYQNSWKYMGTSRLWSVPYALASGSQSDLSGIETDINTLETGATMLQTEINVAETGAGLSDDGSYTANTSANYIAGATSLKDADNKLDAQVKINSDNIAAGKNKVVIRGLETSPDSALFRVVNKNGQTVFAVYNEGVRIYVDDGSKGAKGGFAVGGFNASKGTTQDLLFVSPDSIRAYIDTESVKGAKGGFAVGGFSSVKGVSQDLLVVNADSIRAYIDTTTGKGAKGGFAVGGFAAGKGTAEEYLRVTRDSTRVYLNSETINAKGAKGGFAIGGFNNAKAVPGTYMFLSPDSTRFYLQEFGPGSSSTFNIIGINLDQTQTPLLTASTDTVGITGVLQVQGNISHTGDVVLITPDMHTGDPYNITENSAMVLGDIISDGGAVVIQSGFVWSTAINPTVDLLTKTTDGPTSGQFTGTITGLSPTTTYYIRSYATNANGTGYGPQMTFTTLAPGVTMTDFDGNVYNSVTIGSQVWISTNLKTTHLNNGTVIPKVTADVTWQSQGTNPAYAYYNNDSTNFAIYGKLYNFHTVNTGLLCPTGWHVPTESDWIALQSQLGGGFVAGGKLKEAGTTHWLSPNQDATNETGFTALPAGIRSYMGPFFGAGETGSWWSSTIISVDATSTNISYLTGELMMNLSMTGMGLSVRCMLDAK